MRLLSPCVHVNIVNVSDDHLHANWTDRTAVLTFVAQTRLWPPSSRHRTPRASLCVTVTNRTNRHKRRDSKSWIRSRDVAINCVQMSPHPGLTRSFFSVLQMRSTAENNMRHSSRSININTVNKEHWTAVTHSLWQRLLSWKSHWGSQTAVPSLDWWGSCSHTKTTKIFQQIFNVFRKNQRNSVNHSNLMGDAPSTVSNLLMSMYMWFLVSISTSLSPNTWLKQRSVFRRNVIFLSLDVWFQCWSRQTELTWSNVRAALFMISG